mgnify:CR=1 FL=1
MTLVFHTPFRLEFDSESTTFTRLDFVLRQHGAFTLPPTRGSATGPSVACLLLLPCPAEERVHLRC